MELGKVLAMSRVRIVPAIAVVFAVGCSKPKSERSEQRTTDPAVAVAVADAGADPLFDEATLGALRMQVTGGTPQARALFFRGLLALHSFWYDEATRQFERAIGADPSFAMAHWGLAMSKAKILWGDDDVSAGRAALARIPSPQKLPAREQAWIMAAVGLFNSGDVAQSRKDFLGVMQQLHATYPDDESALFLSLALLGTLRPGASDEIALRERAAELALGVYARNPKHPGAAHYAIHALDTPSLAEKAVSVAEHYATIAPGAFHAQHMPSHVFVRLGRWPDAAKSCQAAWDVSVAWAERERLTAEQYDFHSLAWLMEIAFERGRRADADKALATYADTVRAGISHGNRAAYANQVTSFLARTGEWNRVDELLEPLAANKAAAGPASAHMSHGRHSGPMGAEPPTELFEERAILGARARSAAMRKQIAALEQLLAQRAAVDAKLDPYLAATQTPQFVASAARVRQLAREELLARAKGDDRALLKVLRPLAEDQAEEFTGEGMAGGILYSEEIAATLARLNKPQEALEAYKAVLAVHAGRTSALVGAGRAASKLGDAATAREYFEKARVMLKDADPTFPLRLEVDKALGR